MSNKELTEYEIKILKEVRSPGSQLGLYWGAAMGAASEFLREEGYLRLTPDGNHRLTAKGEMALEIERLQAEIDAATCGAKDG